MDDPLKGKTILITGGAKRVGGRLETVVNRAPNDGMGSFAFATMSGLGIYDTTRPEVWREKSGAPRTARPICPGPQPG